MQVKRRSLMFAIGKRMAVIFCCMLACSAIFAGNAHAESDGGGSFGDEIVYGPTTYNIAQNEFYVIVNAPNTYNAALTALGYDPYDSKFTDSVKAYLSDRSTGGSFWELAQLFSSERPESGGISLSQSSYFSAFIAAQGLYGVGNVFGAIYSQDLADGAKERVEAILAGDVGGSGGESTEYINFAAAMAYKSYTTNATNDPVLVDGDGKYYTYRPYNYFEDGEYKYRFGTGQSKGDAAQIGPVLNVTLDRSIASDFVGSDYGLFIWATYNSGDCLLRFQVFRSTVHTNKSNDIVNNLAYVDTLTYTGNTSICYAYPVTSNNGNYYYTIDDGEHIAIHKRNGVSAIAFNTATGTQQRNINYQLLVTGGSVQPPNNWPDDPPVVAPSPPELPTPTDPVIPNPPTEPTPPEPPTYITQPYYVTNIFTADLQGILDALDEHCQHLQNALYSNLKSLNDNLVSQISSESSSLRSTIGSNIRWLGDIIQRTIDTLDFNIHSYFQWLADQFDFQNSGGYNDSTVISWLKKIYYKLGGGSPVNPKPVDPVADPFDFGAWLYQLWQNFVLDLLALGANGIAEIAHDLGELIHKFPFSIPWDIAAMLALLAAEPQTPVINWPMFYLDAGGVHTVQTTIDLHPYDNYVEPVRVMIKIAFAAVLAWRTKDMMELLTAARGGNSA